MKNRESLISLCEQGFVSAEKCCNEDSRFAQEQLEVCLSYLRAGKDLK